MPGLTYPPPERFHPTPDAPADEARRPSLRWLAWSAFLLLAAYLLFCHGCHGDEDTELLVQANLGRAAQQMAHGR